VSLIFDGFPSLQAAADSRRAALDSEPELAGALFLTMSDSDHYDPFPFHLDPPVVHIERAEWDPRLLEDVEIGSAAWLEAIAPSGRREETLEKLAAAFGGRFAGT